MLSRNATLSNLTTSLTNTIDSGLARSSSVSSNAALQNSEKKLSQLERDMQAQRIDQQLLKRELEVYKISLQEAERVRYALF